VRGDDERKTDMRRDGDRAVHARLDL